MEELVNAKRIAMFIFMPLKTLLNFQIIAYLGKISFVGNVIGKAIGTAIIEAVIAYRILIYQKMQSIEDQSTIELLTPLNKRRSKSDESVFNPFVLLKYKERMINKRGECNKCNRYKPQRCHHCSTCNFCYYKYDHHSYLLNCCIGLYNFKEYIIALIVLILESLLIIMLSSFYLIFIDINSNASLIWLFIFIVFHLFQLIVSLRNIILYIPLIRRNETFVEYKVINEYISKDYTHVSIFQDGNIKTFSSSTDRRVLNPYNLSPWKNYSQVFGETLYDFLNPFYYHKMDGINWPVNEFNDTD